jgi:hypothetical protein
MTNRLLTLPTRLLLPIPRRTARALSNAREATLGLVSAVTDRLELTESLEAEPEDSPGTLRMMTAVECHELLARSTFGRLAYVARAGTPDITPVNYAYADGVILIRSGPGPKLQAAERRERVAFEVDEIDLDSRKGKSVVVAGVATRMRGAEQPWEDEQPPIPWAAGPRREVIRIEPSRITGRLLG